MTDIPVVTVDMEALVNERAQARRDKARAELKAGRDIIERTLAMKSITGLPCPADSPGIKLLYNHGALKKILSYITEPADVMAAYNASVSFRSVLEPKKQALVVEEILNLCFKTQFKKAYLRGEPDLQHLLKARLAGKSMRKIVDNYLVEKPYFKEYTEYDWNLNSDFRLQQTELLRYGEVAKFNPDDLPKLRKAIAALSDSETSDKPFIRGLEVYELPQDPVTLREYRAGVKQLLEIAGDSIWSFSFFPYVNDNVADSYERICEYLKLIPGLKAFTTTINLGFSFFGSNPNACGVEFLNQKIAQLPPPLLPSLRFCDIKGKDDNNLSRIILEAFIRTNPWILRTQLDFIGTGRENKFRDLPTSFKPDTVSILATNIPPGFSEITWPLKMLQLKIHGQARVPLSVLFPLLERFKGTLTHLDIQSSRLWDKPEGLTLDLPQLKIFCVELNRSFNKLDCILKLKSLEKLSIRNYCNEIKFEFDDEDDDDEEEAGNASYMKIFCAKEFKTFCGKGLFHQKECFDIIKIFPLLKQLDIWDFCSICTPVRYWREGNFLKLDKNTEDFESRRKEDRDWNTFVSDDEI